jgi:hypothetical protein
MLNPSVADADVDDPTIRRCMGFAASWQCTELTVVNLFALRATDPNALKSHPDPVGPENNRHVMEQLSLHQMGLVIVAWGAHAFHHGKQNAIKEALYHNGARHLGLTKSGDPRHPLYIKGDTHPVLWNTAKSESIP